MRNERVTSKGHHMGKLQTAFQKGFHIDLFGELFFSAILKEARAKHHLLRVLLLPPEMGTLGSSCFFP